LTKLILRSWSVARDVLLERTRAGRITGIERGFEDTERLLMTVLNDRQASAPSRARQMLNKVPEVTLYFWIVKVLCTTVGETAADFLNERLHLGLTGTTLVMGVLLIVTLFFQFRSRRYVPAVYWLVVVLLSVFGTLITDNLTDNMNVPLTTTSIVFGIALAATFAAWYRTEKTLSIQSIYTTRREAFYWPSCSRSRSARRRVTSRQRSSSSAICSLP